MIKRAALVWREIGVAFDVRVRINWNAEVLPRKRSIEKIHMATTVAVER